MTLIERYLFRQLLGPTLWAMAALATLGILSQSLDYLNLIVEQRQSAWVFIKVTALTVPMTLSLVTPLAILVAGLVTLYRLQTEHEIVVCYAGGVSRWRVLSPALRLAGWATLFMLVLNLWVAPWATREAHAETNAARADLASTLVRAGQFTHPVQSLTIYAQSVSSGGIMHNVFIDQADPKTGKSTTFIAYTGRLIKRNGQPTLLMNQVSRQQPDKNGVLTDLESDEYPLDLQQYVNTAQPKPKESERFMRELLHPLKTDAWAMANKGRLKAEAWSRVGAALYGLVFMAFAVTAVLGGAFSRLGYAKRVTVFCLLAVVVRVIGLVLPGLCIKHTNLNILQLLVPLIAFFWAVFSYVGRRAPKPRKPASHPARRPALEPALAGAPA